LVPHVIYYDAGLLLMALAVLGTPVVWSSRHRVALAAIYLVAVTQIWSSEIGVAPVGAIVIAVFAWSGWLLGGPDRLHSYVAHPEVSPSPNRS
jgi:hypothetical protein